MLGKLNESTICSVHPQVRRFHFEQEGVTHEGVEDSHTGSPMAVHGEHELRLECIAERVVAG